MSGFLSKIAQWISRGANWEKAILVGLLVTVPFLAFYNLEYNPRPWHDEGSALSISRTLVEDGTYAGRSSEGYQTFGAVQSVGPTVLLPVALSFKVLGIGLVQSRIVMAIYLLLTLAAFYRLGQALFGRRTALLAVALLLGSPTVRFLLIGRQVLGEVPALGFFLGGWLVWSLGARTGRAWLYLVAGLLVGAAMVTKSSYIVMGFGTLALLVILNLGFYRQGNTGALITTGVMAFACVAAWWGWQRAYFGIDTFQENAAKLAQLANTTTGFDPHMTVEALKFMVGPDSGHFYYLWGFPALLYVGMLSLRRNQNGFVLAFLVIFTALWLTYYLFWIIPWRHYVLAPAAISALFVGKLWHDLAGGFNIPWGAFWTEIRQGKPARGSLTLVTSIAVVLMTFYPLQGIVRADVFHQYQSPKQLAIFLNEVVDADSVIETWERELAILTDHQYHFPDQSLLAKTHAAVYRGGPRDYALSADYFQMYRPSYLVIGWYARSSGLYDADFLAGYGDLLITIDNYEVYKLHLP